MLGRMNVSDPVCSCNSAPPCALLSAWTERMTHRPSASSRTFGNRSDTMRPDLPPGLNAHGDFIRLPVAANWTRGLMPGNSLPSCLASSGLWSNVSTWLGPPCMNRKMIRFAFEAKCGFRTSALACCASNPPRASSPNPLADARSSSRRETTGVAERQKVRGIMRDAGAGRDSEQCSSATRPHRHPTRMTTFPKWLAASRCSNASANWSNANTRSMTGFVGCAARCAFRSANSARLPT